jgi:predicted transcriptional regulator
VFDKNKFKAQIVLAGMTAKELAERLGINESTLYRKINADGNFTREEISKMTEILHIENPQEIFFANELA